MTVQHTWGELRSMLHKTGRANEAWWRWLLQRLEPLDEATRAGAVEYVDSHMRHHTEAWPEHIAQTRMNLHDDSGGILRPWAAPLVRTLEIRQFQDDRLADTLARLDVPGLSPTRIELNWGRYSEASFLALMQAPALANVKSLHITDSARQTIEALDRIPQFTRLEEIHFNELPDHHVHAFSLVMSKMSALTSLGIHDGIDHKSSWKHIIEALPNPLEKLDVSDLRIENKYIKQLDASGALGALEELDASSCYLGGSGAKALARIDNARIARLDLGMNEIGAAGIVALSEAKFAGSLRTLLLSDNSLRTVGKSLAALADSGILSQLEELDLSYSDLGPGTTKKLCKHDLSNLKRLTLTRTTQDAASIQALVDCEMPELEELDLSECQLDEPAVRALAHAQWPLLHTLHIDQYEELSASSKEILRERFDNLIRLRLSQE